MKTNLFFIIFLVNARLLFSQNPCPYDSIIYNGVVYHTLEIGTQCWLKENLNVGFMIDSTSDQTDNSIIEKYCYHNDTAKCYEYGGLYQWDELMKYSSINGAQGICPNGWHIPTDAEIYTLEHYVDTTINDPNYLGIRGDSAGIILQTGGSSGLNILCAGVNYAYNFMLLDYEGHYWSSTEVPNSGDCVIGAPDCFAYHRRFYIGEAGIMRMDNTGATYRPKGVGMSVRCICGDGMPTSIDKTEMGEMNIKLFPNPCYKFLKIEFNKNFEDGKICIFDNSGKLVIDKKCTSINNSISIDVSNLPNGLYCFSFASDCKNYIKNFVVNK